MRAADQRIILGLDRARPHRDLLEAAVHRGVTDIDTAFSYTDFTAHTLLAAIDPEITTRLSITTKVGFFAHGHDLTPTRLALAAQQIADELGRPTGHAAAAQPGTLRAVVHPGVHGTDQAPGRRPVRLLGHIDLGSRSAARPRRTWTTRRGHGALRPGGPSPHPGCQRAADRGPAAARGAGNVPVRRQHLRRDLDPGRSGPVPGHCIEGQGAESDSIGARGGVRRAARVGGGCRYPGPESSRPTVRSSRAPGRPGHGDQVPSAAR